jgi:FKBP-type peptidyl-prolyl cis-trans isomerase
VNRVSSSRPSTPAVALAGLLLLAAAAVRADDVETPRRFTRVRAPDGIQIRRYNKTEGRMPAEQDRVIVSYEGRLDDGTVFDRTRPRRPASFRLDKVVPCWTAALTRLRVGERAEIICPSDTAYGAKGSPPRVPPHSRLTFEVEILGIE